MMKRFRSLPTLLLFALAACGGDSADDAAEQAEEAIRDAASEVEAVVEDVMDAVEEAAGEAMEEMQEAIEEVTAEDQEEILQTGLLGEWRWVGFQGMDDSTLEVDDPSRYTLAFRVDGVRIQADCNRGQGSYDLDGSSLSFSPFAVTRMACPGDSLDARYLSQLEYVRSWMIEDGHLFLALMADGGIMEFEPGSGPA